MSVIKPLPSWALINRFPAFYEGESLTAVEQTARVYAKMNELIESYNKYVTEINAELAELETKHGEDIACAIKTIMKITSDYINTVDLKLIHQDREIEEFIKAYKEQIAETVNSLVAQMLEMGELDETILTALDDIGGSMAAIEVSWTEITQQWMDTKEACNAAVAKIDNAIEDATGRFATQAEEFDHDFWTRISYYDERIDNSIADAITNVNAKWDEVSPRLESVERQVESHSEHINDSLTRIGRLESKKLSDMGLHIYSGSYVLDKDLPVNGATSVTRTCDDFISDGVVSVFVVGCSSRSSRVCVAVHHAKGERTYDVTFRNIETGTITKDTELWYTVIAVDA